MNKEIEVQVERPNEGRCSEEGSERALLLAEMSVNNFGNHYDFQFVDYVSSILSTHR